MDRAGSLVASMTPRQHGITGYRTALVFSAVRALGSKRAAAQALDLSWNTVNRIMSKAETPSECLSFEDWDAMEDKRRIRELVDLRKEVQILYALVTAQTKGVMPA